VPTGPPHAASPGAGESRAPRSALPPDLARRLAAAGIEDLTDPVAAWCRLRKAGGRRVTGIDVYWLAGAPRGLAAHELPRAERVSLAWAVTAVLFPGFSATSHVPRPKDPVEVVPYDPDWPMQYAGWRELLVPHLGGSALRVEHVGSTSVPGLAAKPVIDIQVSVADVEDEARYVPRIEATGLELRTRDDVRRFFRQPRGQPRTVHVHVCAAGGAWEREHLLFRDYLRGHPGAREAYAEAKRNAALTWHDDRFAYTEAKTGVILDILADAECWAHDTAWSVPAPS
jgi:GrpB-like predicted nucleotidyltransferase (UPF0157 family)